MKKILLIRHPETRNPERFYGITDIDLSVRGHEQANLLSNTLLNENPTVIYSSDLFRSLYPAQLVSKKCKIPNVSINISHVCFCLTALSATGKRSCVLLPRFSLSLD